MASKGTSEKTSTTRSGSMPARQQLVTEVIDTGNGREVDNTN